MNLPIRFKGSYTIIRQYSFYTIILWLILFREIAINYWFFIDLKVMKIIKTKTMLNKSWQKGDLWQPSYSLLMKLKRPQQQHHLLLKTKSKISRVFLFLMVKKPQNKLNLFMDNAISYFCRISIRGICIGHPAHTDPFSSPRIG